MCTDQEWIHFQVEKEKASWLVFEEGGVTKNESLSGFEEEMVRLVVEPEKKEEGQEEGDETLGVSKRFSLLLKVWASGKEEAKLTSVGEFGNRLRLSKIERSFERFWREMSLGLDSDSGGRQAKEGYIIS